MLTSIPLLLSVLSKMCVFVCISISVKLDVVLLSGVSASVMPMIIVCLVLLSIGAPVFGCVIGL
jgi:predicted permease